MDSWCVFERFSRRMQRLGIDIGYRANVPWIYINSINGKKVTEKFMSNHGFTGFFEPVTGEPVRFSDRRKVFELVRRYSQ